jgi:hypothetical protein
VPRADLAQVTEADQAHVGARELEPRPIGGGAQQQSASSPGMIKTGEWTHVAFTRSSDAEVPIVYINGRSNYIDGGLSGTYVPPTTQGIHIGSRGDGAQYFDGKIAAAAYYSSAFSASDVAELFDMRTDPAYLNAYTYLDAASSRWANLGTASSTFTLSSTGLNTGSKLNVSYRDARL